MGFSDMFGSAREDERDRQRAAVVAPSWFGPPDDELPVCVPANLVIARSGRALVALSHVFAYSTGIAVELVVQARGLPERDAQRLFHEQHMPPSDDDPSPAFLRVGVEFADGSRASNLAGRRHWHDPERAPDGPVLMHHGGGGGSSGEGRVSMRPGFWIWPVPPNGAVRIACEWPLLGITLTTVEIDGAELVSASKRALKLWSA